MFIQATRQQLRSRMMTLVANVTSDAAAPDLVPIYNEHLRQAANMVMSDCKWMHKRQSYRFTMGIDQETTTYPAYCSAGNVLELGVWEPTEKRYIPLGRQPIPVALRTDPLDDVGGADDEASRGRPTIFECGDAIRVWRACDQEYEFLLLHTINPEFTADNIMSVVDADLVLYLALAAAWEDEGNERKMETQRQLYAKRLMDLRGWANAASALIVNPIDAFSLDGQSPLYDFSVTRGPGG